MKSRFQKKLHLFSFLLIILLFACNNGNDKVNGVKKDDYTIKTFKADASGWGYDIYKNGKVTIHQPNIPAIDGNFSFKSEEEAKKIAKLVVEKLKNNVFPPSLTKEEVESVIK